jgi:hypothetical protein
VVAQIREQPAASFSTWLLPDSLVAGRTRAAATLSSGEEEQTMVAPISWYQEGSVEEMPAVEGIELALQAG